MNIEQAKAALAKLGGAPSGTIPVTELKAVSERVLSLGMIDFCLKFFPNGRTSPRGGYWEAGKVGLHLRDGNETVTVDFYPKICLQHGGFFNLEDPKSRYPIPGSNPLTLYMIAEDVVLTTDWKCIDKADLARSVRNLNKWCDEFETTPEPEQQKEIEWESLMEERKVIREAVSITLRGLPIVPRSAKQVLELIRKRFEKEEIGPDLLALPDLRSHYRLFEALKQWAHEDKVTLSGLNEPKFDQHFLTSKVGRLKVTRFLLDPEFTVKKPVIAEDKLGPDSLIKRIQSRSRT